MGKARGPKRKEAPARKRLQAGNSGLLHKQTHRNQNGGAHRAAGLDGEAKRVGGWEEVNSVVERLPRKEVSVWHTVPILDTSS